MDNLGTIATTEEQIELMDVATNFCRDKSPVDKVRALIDDDLGYDPAIWRVEDGVITGGSTTEKIKKNYFIATKKSYQNFELRLSIKCSGDRKTGLIKLDGDGNRVVTGGDAGVKA